MTSSFTSSRDASVSEDDFEHDVAEEIPEENDEDAIKAKGVTGQKEYQYKESPVYTYLVENNRQNLGFLCLTSTLVGDHSL